MIRINVEGYCQQCLDFSPEVIAPTRISNEYDEQNNILYAVYNVAGPNESTYTDTIIQCKYRKRCAGIKRYLEQQLKREAIE